MAERKVPGNDTDQPDVYLGYIRTNSTHYGLIECVDKRLQHEFKYFKASVLDVLDGNEEEPKVWSILRPRDEVQFLLNEYGEVTAVSPLPPGTIPRPELLPKIRDGVVVKTLSQFSDGDIHGVLRDTDTGDEFHYGIASQSNTRGILTEGEVVTFQRETHRTWAANIEVHRPRLQSTVLSFIHTKGYGFLHGKDTAPNIYFHNEEVQERKPLRMGDTVEFSLIKSYKPGMNLMAGQIVRVRPEDCEQNKKTGE